MIINFNTYKLPQLLNSNKSTVQNSNSGALNSINYNSLAPLKSDTVSFTAAKFVLKKRTLGSAYEEQLIAKNPRLMGIGMVYDAVLRLIATNSNGVFKISNSIEHLVKDPKTAAGKVVRSGSFNIRDIIRQTAYCKDPYDFDNLLYLLNQMEVGRYVPDKAPMEMSKLIKRGYIPSEEENVIMSYLSAPKDNKMKKYLFKFFEEKGYYSDEIQNVLDKFQKLDHMPSKDEFYEEFEKVSKKIPDIDIRLKSEMITPEQIKKLPEELRYCISQPQDSGYEDIQIRFVRNYVESSKQIPHELIILFGENYHDAKTRESHFVYSHLRKFKELIVNRYFDNEKYKKETKIAKNYIELIEEMFRGKISRKEFINGKNKDYIGDKKESKISFSEDEELLLENYIKVLIAEIGKPFNKAISKTPKNKRKSLRNSLRADRDRIKNDILPNLKSTIEAYNSGKAYEYTKPKVKGKDKKKDIEGNK